MATKTSVSFGRTIRDRRHQLNLTEREVARRVQISHTHLSNLESGKRHPSPKLAGRLANALGVEERELFFLAKPNTKRLFGQHPATEARSVGAAWNEFSGDAHLQRAYKVTREELDFLSRVAQMGEAYSPRAFLYVLLAVRMVLGR